LLQEPLRSNSISLCLQKYINDFTVLIHNPPKVMLLAVVAGALNKCSAQAAAAAPRALLRVLKSYFVSIPMLFFVTQSCRLNYRRTIGASHVR